MQHYFALIEDPRHPGYVKHKLGDILTIVMCAVLCGMDKLCDIIAFAQNKTDFFKTHFTIEDIPSKPTFSRVLAAIDGQKVAETIISLMKEQLGTKGDVIAVDGKAIRSTVKTGNSRSTLQIITAYLTESGVVLGQEAIHEKTNEIPVLQQMLLSYLNVKGKTVTADAMHCQRDTCTLITEKGGDYVLGLKANQGALHDDVALYFRGIRNEEDVEEHISIEKNGGRIEERICRKLRSGEWLQERHAWPGLRTAFSVERNVTTPQNTTTETSYYITSADVSAKRLLEIAREHWRIESMHWSLDVVFSEDECRFSSKSAHICLNMLRKYALGLHKKFIADKSKKCSIKRHLVDCLLNEALLMDVISAT